jgi:glycosyltransferase involved in cell wall biosynthesis
MDATVTVDVAGGPMGGAARFRMELYNYLERTGRRDVGIIGAERRLDPAWLMRRELAGYSRFRRVALNNVSFVVPGGERWTLLGNALHFLTESEISNLDPSLHTVAKRQAAIVRLAARRSDVLVAPCSAMAERVAHIMPAARKRLIVRMHPVSPSRLSRIDTNTDQVILCPIIFEAYKNMPTRLLEWLAATEGHIDPSVKMLVTASPAEVPRPLAHNPRLELIGRIAHADLRQLWWRSRAIYFPPGLESFGFPLAEARANGQPVIARDTEQNREIAGAALFGFTVGNPDSLRQATERALTANVAPQPAPFDPDTYFDWLLGSG